MAKKTTTLNPNDDQEIVNTTLEYKREAEEARRERLHKNRRNWDIYYGKIDWSYKQKGQSTEHLPKSAIAAEQMTAFVRRALVAFGDWFSVKLPAGFPFTEEQVRAIMQFFLARVVVSRNEVAPVHTIIGNGIKQGLMESLIILKVHGASVKHQSYRVEPGDLVIGTPPTLKTEVKEKWRLRIDIVPTEDYYPDPTGRGMYKIHRVERDYADVLEMAEAGVYDMEVVKQLDKDFPTRTDTRDARQRNQNETTTPRRRRRVVIMEGWGNLLDAEGKIKHKNVVWAIANDKYVIRKPEPYPFWHGEDPFVELKVIQNPHTTWSKALYDDASSLNLVLDELFNLMLDGGLESVWGVRQVHTEWLADPRQVSGGIPQNATLVLNDAAPVDGKVVEKVTTGEVPKDAMAMAAMVDREHQSAVFTNDIRLGNFPGKAVKATEVIEASQNASVILDAFAANAELGLITPMLRKAWFTILQYADQVPDEDFVSAIGTSAAFSLSRMNDAERFAKLAKAEFRVFGLSATLTRARDFQKFMALMQVVGTNPVLMEPFMRMVSGEKALLSLMRMINFNPEDLKMSPEEAAQTGSRIQNMAMLSNIMGPNRGSQSSAPGNAERNLPNEARSTSSASVEGEMSFGGG